MGFLIRLCWLCSAITLFIFFESSRAFIVTRVILATDANPFYRDFWPYAAKAWKQLIGVKPTLALIAPATITVDKSLGDVIHLEPIPGIPPGFQAQVIRLLLPALFPNDVCIISDIDQLPIKRAYFVDAVKSIGDDKFVIYNDKCYGKGKTTRFAMCYCAAKGSTFGEIFAIKSGQDIMPTIKKWYSLKLGFGTDELMLYRRVVGWRWYGKRCIKLGDTLGPFDKRRINRHFWGYDKELLNRGYYVDALLLRPYKRHQEELNRLARLVGVRV